MTPDVLNEPLGLVGPGRAGRAFARSWTQAGGRIGWVLGRTRRATDLGTATVFAPDAERFPPAGLVVLAVPDDAVRDVAEEIASRVLCHFAFHLAGALGSDALDAFRRRGSAVASFHPVRPFVGASDEDLRGALVAVEGDPEAVEAGLALAARLGALPYRLAATDRGRYHAAATLAAGGTAAIVSVAVRNWVAIGIPEDVARETLAGLSSRAAAAIAARAFAEAFTGAVARRDAGTVRGHVAALAREPETLALYRALAEETLARTAGAGREEEIRAILRATVTAPDRNPAAS
ncbi:MAG TPA: DUF2520 domain-containing protein [Thermoanaerobaculia bacterium]|nr:DUF2520 domain-containing protein [Thermoanaerobaculia bacterium]